MKHVCISIQNLVVDEFLFITRDYDVVYHIYAYLRVHLQTNMLCKHTQILVCL